MTGTPQSARDSATRSATIRTTVERPAVVAASVRPDNTPEIETQVEKMGVEDGGDAEVTDGGEADDETEVGDETKIGDETEVGDDAEVGDKAETDDEVETGVVVTTVERDTTGGLRTTVDDYVVNLAVAQEVVQIANRHADTQTDGTHHQ